MSFVEEATLKVNDASTKPINQINAALKKLNATAKALSKTFSGTKLFSAGGTLREIAKVNTAVKNLSKNKITLKADSSHAMAAVRSIKTAANKRVTVRVTANTSAAQKAINALGRRRNPVVVPVHVNSSALRHNMKSVFHGIGDEIKEQIINSIVSGITEGMKKAVTAQDIGDTQLKALGATDKQRTELKQGLSEIAKQFPQVTQSSGTQLQSELFSATNQNIDATNKLTGQIAKLIQGQTMRGKSLDNALEGAQDIVKAGDATGAFKDSSGNFDLKASSNFIDLMMKGQAVIGKEMDAKFIRDLIGNMGVTAQTMGPKGMMASLSLAEVMKSPKAGVAIDQMIKQMQGIGVSDQILGNLEDWGLIQTKMVENGTDKKGNTKFKKVSGGSIDPELLMTNFPEFFKKYVIPKMIEKGLDPNSPIDSAKVARDLTGSKTAVRATGIAIVQNPDLLKQQEIMGRIDVSDAQQKRLYDQSTLGNLAAAGAQISDLTGQIANSFERYLIPALQGVATTAKTITDIISPSGDVKQHPGRAAGVVGGGLLAGFAGIAGASKLFSLFTGSAANTAALGVNTGALQANTAALLGQGVAGAVAPGAAAVGLMGNVKSLFGKILKGAGVTAAVSAGLGVTDMVDPKGNLWGLTAGIDGLIKKWTNFDMSKGFDVGKIAQAQVDALSKPGLIDAILKNGMSARKEAPASLNERITRQVAGMRPEVATSAAYALQAANNVGAARGGSTTDTLPGKLADDLGVSITSGAAELAATFNTGSMALNTAATNLAANSEQVAGTLTNAFSSGAQTVAAAILGALAKGVSVNNPGAAQPKPLDTGNATLNQQ